nr:unnamed protein product [Spirometra erinaceieuropaei]
MFCIRVLEIACVLLFSHPSHRRQRNDKHAVLKAHKVPIKSLPKNTYFGKYSSSALKLTAITTMLDVSVDCPTASRSSTTLAAGFRHADLTSVYTRKFEQSQTMVTCINKRPLGH